MTDYREFLGDAYDEETGDFKHDKAHAKAINEKEKCNIVICGASGVGKSTLINAIFGDEVVKAGTGKPITQHLEQVDIPEKGICLWDTKGIEAKDYKGTMESLRGEFRKAIDNAKNEKDIPHVGWVCIKATSGRVEDRDLELIRILEEHGIPAIVVFTKVTGKAEKNFAKEARAIVDESFSGFIKGSYVSVNSEEYEIDDDYSIPVKGLDDLYEETVKRFPDGSKSAKNAFIKAQRVKSKERLGAMKSGSRSVVHFASVAAGTVGASPIPGSDAPLIAAVQSAMIYKINLEFDVDSENAQMTSVLTGIMGVTALAQVGKAVVANALKFIPGIGTLAGGAISSATAIAITEAVGHAYISVMERFYEIDKGEVVFPQEAELVISTFKDFFSYKR